MARKQRAQVKLLRPPSRDDEIRRFIHVLQCNHALIAARFGLTEDEVRAIAGPAIFKKWVNPKPTKQRTNTRYQRRQQAERAEAIGPMGAAATKPSAWRRRSKRD